LPALCRQSAGNFSGRNFGRSRSEEIPSCSDKALSLRTNFLCPERKNIEKKRKEEIRRDKNIFLSFLISAEAQKKNFMIEHKENDLVLREETF